MLAKSDKQLAKPLSMMVVAVMGDVLLCQGENWTPTWSIQRLPVPRSDKRESSSPAYLCLIELQQHWARSEPTVVKNHVSQDRQLLPGVLLWLHFRLGRLLVEAQGEKLKTQSACPMSCLPRAEKYWGKRLKTSIYPSNRHIREEVLP